MSRDAVAAAIGLLLEPGGTAELRAIGRDGRIASGYFDDPALLAERAVGLDAGGEYGGVYITLNPVHPALLSRRANRVATRLGRKDATTADADVLFRRWLPVDTDPVRPSGISATAGEHEAALETAAEICAFLDGRCSAPPGAGGPLSRAAGPVAGALACGPDRLGARRRERERPPVFPLEACRAGRRAGVRPEDGPSRITHINDGPDGRGDVRPIEDGSGPESGNEGDIVPIKNGSSINRRNRECDAGTAPPTPALSFDDNDVRAYGETVNSSPDP